MVSAAPPAANGTTTRMGLVGQSAASAAVAINAATMIAQPMKWFILQQSRRHPGQPSHRVLSFGRADDTHRTRAAYEMTSSEVACNALAPMLPRSCLGESEILRCVVLGRWQRGT